jgi:SPP1 gp7 family putative phage head morphogenesis protein
MKRQLTANNPTSIRTSAAPKTQERELEAVTVFMVEQISKRFLSGAINALQVGTVEKFADAQSGNYAKIFLGLAGKVTNKMLDQFSDDRIEEMVDKILKKVDSKSRDEFYSRIEKTIGISSKELAATEAMKETTNALMLETSQWVKKLRDETLELYTSNTLRAMALGNGLEGITDEFDQLKEKRKNHAKFTARNQVNNYNSISTKIRAQNLGITQAVWVTAHDERVRPSHEAREGKTFNLDEGLYSSLDGKTLLPGTDYQCRCTMTLILPEE